MCACVCACLCLKCLCEKGEGINTMRLVKITSLRYSKCFFWCLIKLNAIYYSSQSCSNYIGISLLMTLKKYLLVSKNFHHDIHCVKFVSIWSYSSLHFPAFGLNTKRYSLYLRIQCEWGEIRTRITPNTDTLCTDSSCLGTLSYMATLWVA